MVALLQLLLILRDCRVAINTLFKHFLRSDRPQLSSACTQNQLIHVPREIFNLKRKRPRNLREQIRNCSSRLQFAQSKLPIKIATLRRKFAKNIVKRTSGLTVNVIKFCTLIYKVNLFKIQYIKFFFLLLTFLVQGEKRV